MDDLRLLERMRRGDEEAFAALYEAHHPPIYRYAVQMCGAAAADDVVQETFLALLRQPAGYDAARGPLLNYLFGIARHHVAKRVALARSDAPLGDEGVDAPFAAAEPSPFDEASQAETVEAVRAAIQSLPPVYRDVVALCELQEMDYAAAAEIVGCPIGTVRSRLHRAKTLLASKLSRDAGADRCVGPGRTRRSAPATTAGSRG